MHNQTNVLLPAWIFEQAGDDKTKLQQLIKQYMRKYPNYTIVKVRGKFAVCEIGR